MLSDIVQRTVILGSTHPSSSTTKEISPKLHDLGIFTSTLMHLADHRPLVTHEHWSITYSTSLPPAVYASISLDKKAFILSSKPSLAESVQAMISRGTLDSLLLILLKHSGLPQLILLS